MFPKELVWTAEVRVDATVESPLERTAVDGMHNLFMTAVV